MARVAYALFTTLFQYTFTVMQPRPELFYISAPGRVFVDEKSAAAETAATHRDVYLASAAAAPAQVTQLLMHAVNCRIHAEG